MNFLGPEIQRPEWSDEARCYYSRIDGDKLDSVRVMKFPDHGDASETNPGTLCVGLAASSRQVRVLDAAGNEQGIVRSRGPGFGYAMRRSEPGRDTDDALSALAFMHRRWLRL